VNKLLPTQIRQMDYAYIGKFKNPLYISLELVSRKILNIDNYKESG